MKYLIKVSLQPIMAGIMLTLAMAGCHNGSRQQDYIVTQDMVVRTVSDTTIISSLSSDSTDGTYYELGAEVDIPLDGPQPLTDSIRLFVRKELYSMFDGDDTETDAEEKLHIPFEKVCKWNGDNIVTDFISHYSPLYEAIMMGYGADYVTLKLVAQTETFVTYYAEYTDCGASCNHSYEYYTFRKRDGHLLRTIVSSQRLKEFVKKYPQYEIDEDIVMAFMGLSDAGFLYGNYIPFGASGGFFGIDTIPYTQIKPYLSKEAQELTP